MISLSWYSPPRSVVPIRVSFMSLAGEHTYDALPVDYPVVTGRSCACVREGMIRIKATGHPEEEPVGSARRLASRRTGPWAPLAGSLRAGQARGLRSQARFAQGRRRRIYPASRRTPEATDPSQAQDDSRARTAGKHLNAEVVERAGREEGFDGKSALGEALLAAVAHERFERDAVGFDAVGPVVLAHQLLGRFDLGDLPGQRHSQHRGLAQLGHGSPLRLAERVVQTPGDP